ISQFSDISEVILFGSRAKGNHKPGSDVDLAVKGDRLKQNTLAQLADYLNEETPLPYFFDLVHYENLENLLLIKHIDRRGILLFKNNSNLTIHKD
ncbi:MAG: nucleotidyltransferase family protein, partial [Microcystaceae cyanobacterium]